ncbi:MAG: hypothetical protein C0407_09720 [Desulfobacca sp.]|nr:hypothetical protein [Desulfobacca sp.]
MTGEGLSRQTNGGTVQRLENNERILKIDIFRPWKLPGTEVQGASILEPALESSEQSVVIDQKHFIDQFLGSFEANFILTKSLTLLSLHSV